MKSALCQIILKFATYETFCSSAGVIKVGNQKDFILYGESIAPVASLLLIRFGPHNQAMGIGPPRPAGNQGQLLFSGWRHHGL
jgi:hypothetical protein